MYASADFYEEQIRTKKGNSAYLWFCVHGEQDSWWPFGGKKEKILAIRFATEPVGPCTVRADKSHVDIKMYFSRAGMEAFTGQWCGRDVWSTRGCLVLDSTEVIGLKSGGATLVM